MEKTNISVHCLQFGVEAIDSKGKDTGKICVKSKENFNGLFFLLHTLFCGLGCTGIILAALNFPVETFEAVHLYGAFQYCFPKSENSNAS